ncbi:MAG: NAD(+)/NADH kinase, partial [Leifsonia sp.]
MPESDSPRHLLVVAHTGRDDSLLAGVQVCRQLIAAGLVPVVSADEQAGLLEAAPDLAPLHLLGTDVATAELELVIVLGGDGTILRAAELARGCGAPLLGVNLGHVGFLAEAESEDVTAVVDAVISQRWEVEERMTLDIRILHDGDVVEQT